MKSGNTCLWSSPTSDRGITTGVSDVFFMESNVGHMLSGHLGSMGSGVSDIPPGCRLVLKKLQQVIPCEIEDAREVY